MLTVPVQPRSTLLTWSGVPGESRGRGASAVTVLVCVFLQQQQQEIGKWRIKPSSTQCSGLKPSPVPRVLAGPQLFISRLWVTPCSIQEVLRRAKLTHRGTDAGRFKRCTGGVDLFFFFFFPFYFGVSL